MKSIVNIKELQKAIKELNKIKKNKEIDIAGLENVLITAKDDMLVLEKNNINTCIRKTLTANVEEAGSTALEENTLKLVLKMKNNDIVIGEECFQCGNKKIDFVQEKYIPVVPQNEVNNYVIDSAELLRLLEVEYCVATDATRPILKGICFKNDKVCALDGFRLSLRTIKEISFDTEFTVNGESIRVLKSILTQKSGSVEMKLYNDYIVFMFDNYEISCKLLEGNYVNFAQLIPQEVAKNKIEINDMDYLKESILFAKEIDKNATPLIKLENEKGELKLRSQGVKSKYEDIARESSFSSHNCEVITFNINYIESVIKNNKYDKMTMHFRNAVSPAVVSENYDLDNLELVLPIRLKKKPE